MTVGGCSCVAMAERRGGELMVAVASGFADDQLQERTYQGGVDWTAAKFKGSKSDGRV